VRIGKPARGRFAASARYIVNPEIEIIHKAARLIRHEGGPVLIAINRRARRYGGFALVATLSLMILAVGLLSLSTVTCGTRSSLILKKPIP
jgi:hypothetical protein